MSLHYLPTKPHILNNSLIDGAHNNMHGGYYKVERCFFTLLLPYKHICHK